MEDLVSIYSKIAETCEDSFAESLLNIFPEQRNYHDSMKDVNLQRLLKTTQNLEIYFQAESDCQRSLSSACKSNVCKYCANLYFFHLEKQKAIKRKRRNTFVNFMVSIYTFV